MADYDCEYCSLHKKIMVGVKDGSIIVHLVSWKIK